MSISFNNIPLDIRTPYQAVEFDNTRAVAGLTVQPHKILVIGYRADNSPVGGGTLKQILSSEQADGFYGRDSMLAAMLRKLKAVNNITETWALAITDDSDSGLASGAITVAPGAATENGTIHLYVHGVYVPVAVNIGDDQDAIAANITAAITNNSLMQLYSFVDPSLNSVTLRSKHSGSAGNFIDVRINYQSTQQLPAGVSVTIVPMAGGDFNAIFPSTFATLGDEQFHTIIMPYTDVGSLQDLEPWLADRWGPMVQKEGHAFAAANGTHAELTTLGNSRNSQFVTIMGLQNSPTTPWEAAAVIGGIDALEPDPARPRQTLRLPGILAPAVVDRYTREERDLHLHDGISTFTVDAGGNMAIERLITTYQTNSGGIPDPSYLDVTTMRTLSFIRFSMRARIALRYPRFKLAGDTEPDRPGQAIVRPKDIRNELIALFTDWQNAGLVEDVEQFKTELLVIISPTDPNRIDVQLSPNLINQFRVFAAQVQFII